MLCRTHVNFIFNFCRTTHVHFFQKNIDAQINGKLETNVQVHQSIFQITILDMFINICAYVQFETNDINVQYEIYLF